MAGVGDCCCCCFCCCGSLRRRRAVEEVQRQTRFPNRYPRNTVPRGKQRGTRLKSPGRQLVFEFDRNTMLRFAEVESKRMRAKCNPRGPCSALKSHLNGRSVVWRPPGSMASPQLEAHSCKHGAGLEGPPARKASTPVQGSGGEMQDDHLKPGSRQGSKMLVSCPPGGGTSSSCCRLLVALGVVI